ncbi:hypothetical protein [Antribacter gilvus]|uniref:hypothetical protein n=1 Tax=Antribacter gilvus TaxID=2304675 RepID=UPI0013E0E936|nr:hypothetical protein [Antribacter gilvus]
MRAVAGELMMSDQSTGAVRTAGPDRHPDQQPAGTSSRPDAATALSSAGRSGGPAHTDTAPEFTTPDGLRFLLNRLAGAGDEAWSTDLEAAELLAYCTERYRALARKYRLTEHDAVVAAFEVLRNDAVRHADNPWAVVTVAVKRTLGAEARADQLLCSPSRARHLMTHTDLPPALRIGDPSTPTATPAGETAPWLELALATTNTGATTATDLDPTTAATIVRVQAATRATIAVLVAVGWPQDVALAGLEHITTTLTTAAGVPAARDRLRKDRHPAAELDVDRAAWTRLVTAVLGTPARHGLLHRLLAGHTARLVIEQDAHDLTPPHQLDAQEAGHAA